MSTTDRPDTIFRHAKLQYAWLTDEDSDAFFIEFLLACDLAPEITSETPWSEIEHDPETLRLVRRATYLAAEEVRLSHLEASRP